MEKKNSISTIFIIAVVLLVVIAAAAKITSSKSSKTEEGTGTAAMTEYWTEGSAPAQELRDYVSIVPAFYSHILSDPRINSVLFSTNVLPFVFPVDICSVGSVLFV